MPYVPQQKMILVPYRKKSGHLLAPECFFRRELVHVATRILLHEGAPFMATYHRFL